jgi:hypothetical protein
MIDIGAASCTKEHPNELIKTITEVVNGFITMIMYQK